MTLTCDRDSRAMPSDSTSFSNGQPMSHARRVCNTGRIGQRLSDVPRPGF